MILKIFGLQRSGNHTVINWLLGLEGFNPLFFNYVDPYRSPLKNYVPVSVPKDARVLHERKDSGVVRTNEKFEKKGGPALNGNILCSYENLDIKRLDILKLNQSLVDDFGEYKEFKSILIIRNTLNLFESYYQKIQKDKNRKFNTFIPESLKYNLAKWLVATLDGKFNLSVEIDVNGGRNLLRFIELWKSYARLVIDVDSLTRGEFIPVIFDEFVSSKSARDKLAKKLGYKNNDKNFDFISDAGGGSSFSDRVEPPTQKELKSRWLKGKAIDIMKPYFENDYEFHDLCRLLFPSEFIEPVIEKPLDEKIQISKK